MEEQDYLKRQIDQMGRVLGKLLADLIGLKNQGQVSYGVEISDQVLKDELGLDLDELIDTPIDLFIEVLRDKNNLSNNALEKLADILFILAEGLDQLGKDHVKMKRLYEKTLIIYEYLDKEGSTYSFDRHFKIEKIKNTLY